jgi:two-component system chemotaxis response regulator CheB
VSDGVSAERKIKVLVVDDSAIVRAILRETLSAVPGVESVSTAPDAYVARDKILREKPDVLTLDLDMPRMDGLTFLRKLMRYNPMPVVVISSLTRSQSELALEALRLGAVEVLPKPGGPYSVGDLKRDLPFKLMAAARASVKAEWRDTEPAAPPAIAARFNPARIVAMGASTGGVQALEEILKELPENFPGIVVTQHIPAAFSASLANRLDRCCQIRVKEAVDGDPVLAGQALIAPGDRHLIVRRSPTGYRAALWDGPPVCFQRPSVDVMFESVARSAGADGIGVLLTGMGEDGANGLLAMKNSGARTLAQDQESCVVFGMPKEAIGRGAVDRVLPLPKIASVLRAEATQ